MVGPQVLWISFGLNVQSSMVSLLVLWRPGQKFHKTATSLAKKLRYMPLVAPLQGVTEVDWSKIWLESMLELNVDINYEPFGAICRAPSQGGGLCARSCTSEEIGAFVNKLLKTGSDNSISSHSFKHTTLVWCSAYGLDEPSRTLLGASRAPRLEVDGSILTGYADAAVAALLQHVVKHQEGPLSS